MSRRFMTYMAKRSAGLARRADGDIAEDLEEARHRQGRFIVDALARFFSGQPLLYQVTGDMLDKRA